MFKTAKKLFLLTMLGLSASAFATPPLDQGGQGQSQATGSSPTSMDGKMAEVKKTVDDLNSLIAKQTDQIKDLTKNDSSSKYLLILLGGGIGFFGSLLAATVSGIFAIKNATIASNLASTNKELELASLSNAKTKELLFNQIAGFAGGTQPRASALSSIYAYCDNYKELHPLFRVFVLSQLEHVITVGVSTSLEQSNALLMLKLSGPLGISLDQKNRIYTVWSGSKASSRGLTMSTEAVAILSSWAAKPLSALANSPSKP